MGIIRLWTQQGEKDEGLLECGKCYQISGEVDTIASASENITLGIIDWSLVYGGQPVTALANIFILQTIEFTTTGSYTKTFDLECLDFLRS